MTDRWPLPRSIVEHARRFYDSGQAPATPRVASTVVLLRAAAGGFEAYAIRRASTMAFASGMYAFPGGGVDPLDEQLRLDWVGPSPGDWARRFDLPVGRARAVVCAAVREVFEEAGVLLAGPTPTTVVGDVSDEGWESARQDLVARRQSLTALLGRRGLALRSDLLAAWTRWITPEFEPRRFDTYFFVAVLPEGQRTRDVSGEADHTMWVRPAEAVRRFRAREIAMLPPTAAMFEQLSAYPSIEAVLAAARDRDAATAVMPRLELDPDGSGRMAI